MGFLVDLAARQQTEGLLSPLLLHPAVAPTYSTHLKKPNKVFKSLIRNWRTHPITFSQENPSSAPGNLYSPHPFSRVSQHSQQIPSLKTKKKVFVSYGSLTCYTLVSGVRYLEGDEAYLMVANIKKIFSTDNPNVT